MAFGNALGDFEQKIVEPLAFGGRINLNKASQESDCAAAAFTVSRCAVFFAVKTSASCREIIG